MILVKRPLVGGNVIVPPEGLGNHHHQGVGGGTAGADEELHAVVEAGRVAAAFLQYGEEFRYIVSQLRGGHRFLVSLQAIGVAAQGVDLAVVGNHAKGLGEPPTGKGICAVSLMHDSQGCFDIFVGQVGIEGEQLRGQKHALVANRAAGHGGDIKLLGPVAQGLFHGAFGALTGDIQAALQFFPAAARAVDEQLADHRLGIPGDIAQAGIVGGHVAPA